MTDYSKLKELAEAATPGRVHDRLDSCGGGLKYECFGDDGSLVLKVDHKNDEWGFVGDKGEADEAFFLACTPAAVLGLVKDAMRYRFLRDADDDVVASCSIGRTAITFLAGLELDEHIDAAMSKEASNG